MDAQIEKMFAISTIDDPVLARQLYLEMESSLPIAVRITERGFQGLKEQGVSVADPDQVYEIQDLFYSSDMGGILCNLLTKAGDAAKDDKNVGAFVMSLTHLRIDSTHPLSTRIKEYQKKRNTRLAIANSGKSFKPANSKKKKRGFGS
jgi:hypothetical protein